LILQEKIEGTAKDLYTITLYANERTEILGYTTGYKIRQFPPEAGTIIAGRTEEQPELYDLASKLVRALSFHGMCNIEFIHDRRDGSFRLIEINPRAGMWHNTRAATGINLPYLAYQDVTGEPCTQGIACGREGITWVHLRSDLFFSLLGYTLSGYSEHTLGLGAWLASLHGTPVLAVESKPDPLPMLRDWVTLPPMLAKLVFKRVVRVFSPQHSPGFRGVQSSEAADLESKCRSNKEPTAA
jgi:predicted ATP-grasp superfamily ATP-dependent carboligase